MKLSVIIPVYNVEKYLEDCLISMSRLLLSEDVEIIAVNDGSTDESYAILSKWKEKYKNLVILCQKNSGLSSARNTGLKEANGEYIVFIDSDDHIDEGNLLAIVDKYCKTNTDIIVNDYWELYDKNIETHSNNIPANRNYSYSGIEFILKYYKPLKSMVWRSIYKRKFLLDNLLLFHEGIYFEDVEFTPLAFSKAKSVIYSGIPFYYYRKRGGSITSSSGSERKVNDALSVWKVLNKEASREENQNIAPIMRELGFHCFLKQYSMLNKCLSKEKLADAKSYSANQMESYKYNNCSILFRLLPDKIFHILLKHLR